MNTIVTWIWRGERSYDLTHAGLLADGLKRFMTTTYRLVVLAQEVGTLADAEVMSIPPLAETVGRIKTPELKQFPSSYRRLWLFSEEAKSLGEVVLMVDVDVVVTGDWSHLFAHAPEQDFMGWRPGQLWGNQENRVGGGVWRLRTGTRPQVWDDFVRDPSMAIASARQAGYRGSDQAWISHCLSSGAPVWPNAAGIRSVRDFNRDCKGYVVRSIPPGTCMVHFNGNAKPWQPETQRVHPWLAPYVPGMVVPVEDPNQGQGDRGTGAQAPGVPAESHSSRLRRRLR